MEGDKLLRQVYLLSKKGAYEGILNANKEIQEQNALNYADKYSPLTTKEFESKEKQKLIWRVLLISTLFLLGFINFDDLLRILLTSFG